MVFPRLLSTGVRDRVLPAGPSLWSMARVAVRNAARSGAREGSRPARHPVWPLRTEGWRILWAVGVLTGLGLELRARHPTESAQNLYVKNVNLCLNGRISRGLAMP